MRVQFSLRLDGKLLERIDRIAQATDVTRTDVIERALAVGLGEDEDLIVTAQTPVLNAIIGALGDSRVLQVVASVLGEQVDPKQVAKFKAAQRGTSRRSGLSPA